MKIKNTTKRLIVLNYKENGKIFKSLPLGAGAEVENEHLTEADVAYYVGKKAIEVVGAITGEGDKNKSDPIVLPEDLSPENLKEVLTVEDMKQYCRENKIKGFSKLDEDELVDLILNSLEPKE